MRKSKAYWINPACLRPGYLGIEGFILCLRRLAAAVLFVRF
jgi:hypothetical protein